MKNDKLTWMALAEKLEVSSQAVVNWRKLPGAPVTSDLEKWVSFVKENGLGLMGNRVGKDREALLIEKLETEIALNKAKLAKEERTVVDRSAVDAFLLHVATLQKTILYQRLCRELGPKGEGKTAQELNVFGQAVADELATIFSNAIESWNQS